MRRFTFVLICTLSLSACDGRVSPLAPTSVRGEAGLPNTGSVTLPVASAEAPPRTPHILSGMVFENASAGRVAVAGVEVYCDSCGSPDGHTFAYTDAQGLYSFSWAYDGAVPLLIKKQGYEVVNSTRTFANGMGTRIAVVDGDTRFDIELVVTAP